MSDPQKAVILFYLLNLPVALFLSVKLEKTDFRVGWTVFSILFPVWGPLFLYLSHPIRFKSLTGENRLLEKESMNTWKTILTHAHDFHVDKGFWSVNPNLNDHLAQSFHRLEAHVHARLDEIIIAMKHPDRLVAANAVKLINESEFGIRLTVDMKKTNRIAFPEKCCLCLGQVKARRKAEWFLEDKNPFSIKCIRTAHLPDMPFCIKHLLVPVKRKKWSSSTNRIIVFTAVLLFTAALCFFEFPFLLPFQRVLSVISYSSLYGLYILFSILFYAAGAWSGWWLITVWASKTGRDISSYHLINARHYETLSPIRLSLDSGNKIIFHFINKAYAQAFSELNQKSLVKKLGL
ncbi:MAG: hypothetical protein JW774_13255 [Candidatus Aureabacteria bacterium]|nr:hypothetical protein [Candidatus Auribacterota bacterium]